MGGGHKQVQIDQKYFWRPIKEALTTALILSYLYMKLKINHKKQMSSSQVTKGEKVIIEVGRCCTLYNRSFMIRRA
jgi:hypothetical protein